MAQDRERDGSIRMSGCAVLAQTLGREAAAEPGSRYAGAGQDCARVRRWESRRTCDRALMRVLFGNGTPRGVAVALSGHTVEEARSHGWDTLRNGELLNAAEAAGFDVLLTTDRNIRHH